jgi:DNA-directed RNA polymerase subunit M
MFCPDCGTLAFPKPNGTVECPNYKCGYHGASENKITMVDGSQIDISEASSTSKAKSQKHLTEVIDDSDQQRGVLTTRTYICPKCDSDEVYAELQQTRASDEPETRILTCSPCGHGWREY